ncbi:MAG: hypothetical protein KH452_10775 [Clostridiales bacterium]|nr:hypothetical protein [Clostridiales bacterium]
MKKFTKFCFILCGILIVLGIIGITAGMALGVKPGQFLNLAHYNNHTFPWNEEDFWEEIREDGMDEHSEYELEKLYDSANFRKLNLELNHAVIHVYHHEKDGILVKAGNAGNYFRCREDEDELTLTDDRPGSQETLQLEIYLPGRKLEKMNLEIGASVLYADKLYADEITITVGAGEVSIGELMADREADLEVGAGEMEVKYFSGGNLDLECGIGVLYVTAEGSTADYNYEVTGGIGEISINGESYAGLGFEHRKDNGAARKVQMECGIGEIALDFAEDI